MSRAEDPRFIPDTLIWTEAETKRCDDLTAHNTVVLARLQGDQLDRVLGGEVRIRRPWHSDDAVRRLAIDNMHPDDLAEILAARLIGARVRVIRDSSDLGLDAGTEMEIIAVEGGKMDLSVTVLDMTIAGVSINHPDLEIILEGR